MRSILALTILFEFSFCTWLSAKPIDEATAQNVAINWMRQQAPASTAVSAQSVLSPSYAALETLEKKDASSGVITCFIVNLSPGGYVIVSADDMAYPVIYYAPEGKWRPEVHCPSFEFMLSDAERQVMAAAQLQENEVPTTTTAEWAQLRAPEGALGSPLGVQAPSMMALLETKWDQNSPYNDDCPLDGSGPGGNAWAGCVAVAMGQVMKYHCYPEQGIGHHGYKSRRYGWLAVDFGSTTYDWLHLSNPPISSCPAVAQLLFHCGVAVNMDYGPDGSGAFISSARNALVKYFGYKSSTAYVRRASYSSAKWHGLIKNEIDLYRPVIYGGHAKDGSGGHAFVIDGYDTAGLFRVNWGWSGQDNGWFNLDVLIAPSGSDFRYRQEAVIRIASPLTPELVNKYRLPSDVASVTFSADGAAFITTDYLGQNPNLWDVSTGNLLAPVNVPYGYDVRGLFYTPDGQNVLVFADPHSDPSGTGKAMLFPADLQTLPRPKYALSTSNPISSYHPMFFYFPFYPFSADGTHFIFDNRIYLTGSGNLHLAYQGTGLAHLLQFDPSGQYVIGFAPQKLHSWPASYLFLATWSPDTFWQQPVTIATHTMDTYDPVPPSQYDRGPGDDPRYRLEDLSFSPDGSRVAYLNYRYPKILRTQDMTRESGAGAPATGEMFFYDPQLVGTARSAGCSIFSPASNNAVLTVGWNHPNYVPSGGVKTRSAILWDLVTHKRLQVFPDVLYTWGRTLRSAAFSSDGSRLLTISYQDASNVCLWKVKPLVQGPMVKVTVRNGTIRQSGLRLVCESSITAFRGGRWTSSVSIRRIAKPPADAQSDPSKGVLWLWEPGSQALTVEGHNGFAKLYTEVNLEDVTGGFHAITTKDAWIKNLHTANVDHLRLSAGPRTLADGQPPSCNVHYWGQFLGSGPKVFIQNRGIGANVILDVPTDVDCSMNGMVIKTGALKTLIRPECLGIAGAKNLTVRATDGDITGDIWAYGGIRSVCVRRGGIAGDDAYPPANPVRIVSGYIWPNSDANTCDVGLVQADVIRTLIIAGRNYDAASQVATPAYAGSVKKVVTTKGSAAWGRYWTQETINGTEPKKVPEHGYGNEFVDFLPGTDGEWPY